MLKIWAKCRTLTCSKDDQCLQLNRALESDDSSPLSMRTHLGAWPAHVSTSRLLTQGMFSFLSPEASCSVTQLLKSHVSVNGNYFGFNITFSLLAQAFSHVAISIWNTSSLLPRLCSFTSVIDSYVPPFFRISFPHQNLSSPSPQVCVRCCSLSAHSCLLCCGTHGVLVCLALNFKQTVRTYLFSCSSLSVPCGLSVKPY